MKQQPDIIFEDEDLVVLSKPSGLLSIPDRFDPDLPSLHRTAEGRLGTRLWVVHRLDRETSGVVVFAKGEEPHRYLSQLFERHEVTKLYAGLVRGKPHQPSGRIDAPIAHHPGVPGKMIVAKNGKPSITDYKLAEQWGGFSLLQFQIHTGRTHQIRVHLQELGLSLVGDKLYGDGKPLLLSDFKRNYKPGNREEVERPLLSRMALHAYHLSFEKPDGTAVKAEAPLPKDMAAAVAQLSKWSK